MTRVGDRTPLGTIAGIGPRSDSVQGVPGYYSQEGPYHWQAVGPRGVQEGLADSYKEAWDAARTAPVGRLSDDEDATMPDYEPLWRKYPAKLVKCDDGRWKFVEVHDEP